MGFFQEKTIRKNKHLEPNSSGRKRKLGNFQFALSLGANWVDQDKGNVYHIQEYYEALHDPKIPQDKKPTKIRMTSLKDNSEVGWVDEYTVAERMKDPEPDPRY